VEGGTSYLYMEADKGYLCYSLPFLSVDTAVECVRLLSLLQPFFVFGVFELC
jgi:hypothetical protein